MDNKPDRGSTDGRIERAKDAALGSHKTPPTVADEIGEAAGGISGVILGAGIGSTGGPAGALIGGIAGALGGWWAGRAVAEAAERLTEDDETYYRAHYESQPNQLADRDFEDVRGAYLLGHIAAANPNFAAREFEEIEPELERGWTAAANESWARARNYARAGYGRGRERRANRMLSSEIEPGRPDERRK